MNRVTARFAAYLLMSASLCACASTAADKAQTAAAAKAPAQGSSRSLAGDLDLQIQNARALRLRGDYPAAVRILSQLTLVAPDNAGVVAEYGKTLVEQGRAHDALDFLKRAVQLAPGDWTLYSATGIAYDQSGQYSSAKIFYQQALALKPGEASVLNNYALSRMQAGDLAQARELFNSARAAGANDPKVASNIALLAQLAPRPAAATPAPPAAHATTPVIADEKPSAHRAGPKPVETVMMQQIPVDTKAGPVKTATAAPRSLTSAASSPPAAVPRKIATRSGKKAASPIAPVSLDKHEPHKVAAKAPAKPAVKTAPPALRMTADAATP
ncbi:MAG: tetratricopeptide repeat protein [Alphaproteobacteria bacterium]|nr:tetratricopeptide repeat protein [Alphaproteobacteria bacterium]MBV9693885.1 tetratricopeptide repeat protein [Alphaproteobacteria bacterium]